MFATKVVLCLIKRQSTGPDPLTLAPFPFSFERQTGCLQAWKRPGIQEWEPQAEDSGAESQRQPGRGAY